MDWFLRGIDRLLRKANEAHKITAFYLVHHRIQGSFSPSFPRQSLILFVFLLNAKISK